MLFEPDTYRMQGQSAIVTYSYQHTLADKSIENVSIVQRVTPENNGAVVRVEGIRYEYERQGKTRIVFPASDVTRLRRTSNYDDALVEPLKLTDTQ